MHSNVVNDTMQGNSKVQRTPLFPIMKVAMIVSVKESGGNKDAEEENDKRDPEKEARRQLEISTVEGPPQQGEEKGPKENSAASRASQIFGDKMIPSPFKPAKMQSEVERLRERVAELEAGLTAANAAKEDKDGVEEASRVGIAVPSAALWDQLQASKGEMEEGRMRESSLKRQVSALEEELQSARAGSKHMEGDGALDVPPGAASAGWKQRHYVEKASRLKDACAVAGKYRDGPPAATFSTKI